MQLVVPRAVRAAVALRLGVLVLTEIHQKCNVVSCHSFVMFFVVLDVCCDQLRRVVVSRFSEVHRRVGSGVHSEVHRRVGSGVHLIL